MNQEKSTKVILAKALCTTFLCAFAIFNFALAQTITNVNQVPPNPNQPLPTEVSTTSEPGGAPSDQSGEQTSPSGATQPQPPSGEKPSSATTSGAKPSGDSDTRGAVSATLPITDTVDSESESRLESLPFLFYLVLAALLALAFLFLKWLREFLKRDKTEPQLPSEEDGKPCPTCGGKGTITKRRTISTPCGHCKQTGQDICHHCGGSGRYGGGLVVPQTQEEVESLMKCDSCKGSGFSKPPVSCCMCKGAKKEYAAESYEEACPTCKGTGRVSDSR